VGGAARAVHVFDTKKWAAKGQWTGCLKYELSSLFLAGSDTPDERHQQLCYVGGLDSEVGLRAVRPS
jgi:hypothetical protein